MGAVLALTVLAGLAGCTPAAKPVVALAYLGERPTLVTVSCSDYKVDSVNVFTAAADDATGWAAQTDSRPGPAEMVLLEAPAGWTVTERTLDELKPGTAYTLMAFSHAKPSAILHFTVDQVGKLAPGEVLSAKPGSDTKVMSDKEFREMAADSC